MVYMQCSKCGQYIDDWRINGRDKKVYCDECIDKAFLRRTKLNPKVKKGKGKLE